MIKSILKQHPNVKTHILTGLVVSTIYVGTQVLSLDRSMWLGFFQLIGFLPVDFSGTTGGVFVNYVFLIFKVLTPGILIGLVLTALKKQRAFQVAILSTVLAHMPYTVLAPFTESLVMSGLIVFAGMFVAYLITQPLIQRVSKARYVWGIALLLVAIDLFPLRYLSSTIEVNQYKTTRNAQLKTAIDNLDFKAYYPTYTPKGLNTDQPELEGYPKSKYINENVVFNVGKLEFRESKKLINQEQVLNFTTNCDISSVWFAIRSDSEVDQARIERSLDNLSICHKLGTTDDGHDVYVQKSNNSQYLFYYMAIGNTNIVMQNNTLTRPRYSEDFDKEVFKMFNSMKVLEPSKLMENGI